MKIKDTKTAMVAEENDNQFSFFTQAIEKVSIKIVLTRAEDGEVLLEYLKDCEINPDILFLNLFLPLQNGRECLKIIRNNKKFDFMPVIIYSNPHEYKSIEFCYRERANLFVFKPRTVDELALILERIFVVEWSKLMYYPPFDQFVMNAHYAPPPSQI